MIDNLLNEGDFYIHSIFTFTAPISIWILIKLPTAIRLVNIYLDPNCDISIIPESQLSVFEDIFVRQTLEPYKNIIRTIQPEQIRRIFPKTQHSKTVSILSKLL